ncbi:hypothetical protein KY290_005569 [Solanum tuberosum]|uniref:NB-ARC domain containing protein n=1 Tax=Solanum tuberosum TaxID=4113 RepID=A0ABQ7WEI0_SOLTU|nr:hypothetical protein KY290_005569 [Solanum tuberosum]
MLQLTDRNMKNMLDHGGPYSPKMLYIYKSLLLITPIIVCWEIWKARCTMRFEHKQVSTNNICHQVLFQVKESMQKKLSRMDQHWNWPEATVDLALDPVNAKVVADGPQHDARGVETIEWLVDNMTQQVDNANKKIESDVGTNSIALMNAKSTGEGVELVHESNWDVVTKKKSPSIGIGSPISNTVQPVVDSQTINSGAREIVPQVVMCFNTFDALTNNIVHEINSSQVNSTNELVISKEKQGVTSTLRWIDIADQEEEQVTSPPMQKKLSPIAPAFVPSSAKLVTPRQGLSPSTNVAAILSDHLVSSNIEKLASLAPININKQLQVGGSSTLSPNKFANLDDEDISEEGEEGEEEEMLDYCFAIVARNVDISPGQQQNEA